MTPSHTTGELLKSIAENVALYPKLASRITHLRTIFDTIEHYPLNPTSVDLWVEDARSATTDLLTLLGDTRALVRQQIALQKSNQETSHD